MKRYQISEFGAAEDTANLLFECCIGFWCWYCSVAQMARYLYGYTKVLDGDSDINRPDNYSDEQPVGIRIV